MNELSNDALFFLWDSPKIVTKTSKEMPKKKERKKKRKEVLYVNELEFYYCTVPCPRW